MGVNIHQARLQKNFAGDNGPMKILQPPGWPRPKGYSNGISASGRLVVTGGIVGWKDASETMNVTTALRERGYSELEIEMLWGGNLLRVLDEVQQVAEELQSQ